MKSISTALLFALPLALALGCGGEESNDPGNGVENPPACTPKCGEVIKTTSLHAVAPSGINGKFYVGPSPCSVSQAQIGADGGYECALACDANSCNVKVNDFTELRNAFIDGWEVEVAFVADNYITIPRTIDTENVTDGSTVEVNWDDTQTWGQLFNGPHMDSTTGNVQDLRTWRDGDKIMRDVGLLVICTVSGLTCSGTDGNGSTIEERVSDDGVSLEYELVTPIRSFEGRFTPMTAP